MALTVSMVKLISGKCRKPLGYLLNSMQMLGCVLRNEAVDDIQSMVFSYEVCCRNCQENTTDFNSVTKIINI